MPNNAVTRGPEAPQLVVMDLLGVFMENDQAVKGAIAAAFQAHGERVDEDHRPNRSARSRHHRESRDGPGPSLEVSRATRHRVGRRDLEDPSAPLRPASPSLRGVPSPHGTHGNQ